MGELVGAGWLEGGRLARGSLILLHLTELIFDGELKVAPSWQPSACPAMGGG